MTVGLRYFSDREELLCPDRQLAYIDHTFTGNKSTLLIKDRRIFLTSLDSFEQLQVIRLALPISFSFLLIADDWIFRHRTSSLLLHSHKILGKVYANV